MQVRLDKRARIIADGGQAYPVDLLRDHTLVQVRQKYTDDTGEPVSYTHLTLPTKA